MKLIWTRAEQNRRLALPLASLILAP